MAKENLKTEAPAKKLMLHWVKVALLVALTDYVSVLVSYFLGVHFIVHRPVEQYRSGFPEFGGFFQLLHDFL